MSLIPHSHHHHFNPFGRRYENFWGDMARFEQGFAPYWRENAFQLNVGKELAAIVNDDKKFAVSIDVSHFKPEELKVNLDGRVLTIEADQKQQDEHNFLQRSFTRKWTVPQDVNVAELKTSLTDDGHLTIEAPKNGLSSIRSIPITPALKN